MRLSWAMTAACAFLLLGCAGGKERQESTSTAAPTAAAATEAAAATLTTIDAPLRKTYARGEVVDIPRGTLFLDPKTGGGEAWENVKVSPSGMLAPWNGADGKQPPVLYETDTGRRIALDTGGQFGSVLGFAPDDSEVSVSVGQELLIASTETGRVRLRFQLPPGSIFPSAAWGPDGRVAVRSLRQDRSSVGLLVWTGVEFRTFSDVPAIWLSWSPDGRRLLAAGIEADSWLALTDVGAGTFKRIEGPHPNPHWSESGQYFAAQVGTGDVMVYRDDGIPHMRLGGVCAEVANPWVGDQIGTWGYGRDVLIAMDGRLTPYVPPSHGKPTVDLRPDGSVAVVDRLNGSIVLAELKPRPGVALTGTLGEPWTTPDGRGRLAIGGGAKGGCENVGPFNVELVVSTG